MNATAAGRHAGDRSSRWLCAKRCADGGDMMEKSPGAGRLRIIPEVMDGYDLVEDLALKESGMNPEPGT